MVLREVLSKAKTEVNQTFNVIPFHDRKEHIENRACWCQPTLEYKDAYTGSEVWVHRELQ